VLRPVNGDRFLVSFSQPCRGLGRPCGVPAVGSGGRVCSRVGARLGERKWKPGLIDGILAIGAGALICSISFELAANGFQLSRPLPLVLGIALGRLPSQGGQPVEGSGPAGPARWRQRRLAPGAGRTSRGMLAIGVVKVRGVSVALVVIWSRTCPR
jgi:hypothetical protein